jgi:hypothetical protein
MSTILVDTLTGKTVAGDITVTSEGGAATMQLQQGLAKAWINFNGTSTIAARDSLNLSGLVDNGQGDYTVNFTNAFGTANYTVSGTASGNADADRGYTGFMAADTNNPPTASALRTKFGLGSTGSANGQLYDGLYNTILNHGDLA